MNDLIDRQAAIDALAKFVPYAICDESTRSYTNGLTDAYNLICQLPSAQPERKTEDFEKGLHDMFDHIWNCEILSIQCSKTVGELMRAVIQLYGRVVQPCEEGKQDANQEEGS